MKIIKLTSKASKVIKIKKPPRIKMAKSVKLKIIKAKKLSKYKPAIKPYFTI